MFIDSYISVCDDDICTAKPFVAYQQVVGFAAYNFCHI